VSRRLSARGPGRADGPVLPVALLGGSPRRGEDRQYLLSLLKQPCDFASGRQLGATHDLEPADGFIGLLDGNGQPGDELTA
jgi:hypothetical protein